MSSYAIGLKIQVCGSDVDLKHKKKDPDFQLVERGNISYLQESSDSATGMPKHRCQVWHRFAFLAELQQGILSGLWAGQLIDPLVDLFPVYLSQGCDIRYSLQKAK